MLNEILESCINIVLYKVAHYDCTMVLFMFLGVLVLVVDVLYCNYLHISPSLAALVLGEIFRRFVWNFFRVEFAYVS